MTTTTTASDTQPSQTAAPKAEVGRFVTGSIFRHVVVMTLTGTVGLMAVFFVDVATLFYLSRLHNEAIIAGVGYASTIAFLIVSVGIGLSIGVTALTSRALGSGKRQHARERATAGLLASFVLMVAAVLAAIIGTPWTLDMMGATGEARVIAQRFLYEIMPGMPMLGLAMAASGVLRAVGDAKRAMYVTLLGAIATAILDPIFIFGLGWGVDGAAVGAVLPRFVMAGVGLYGAIKYHDLIARPRWSVFMEDLGPLLAIAGPAILTNLATPIGNVYVTAQIARFGDGAMAGWSIIGRIMPVAFTAVFALSGSVGAIFGQNLGAKRHDRVRQTLVDALKFTIIYTFIMWGVLALFANEINYIFAASGDAAMMVSTFCYWVAGTYVFMGALFVANSAFNNLGAPTMSTLFNWGRATLGIIPFTYVGAMMDGARGVLIGWGVGAIVFGTVAMFFAFRHIGKLRPRQI